MPETNQGLRHRNFRQNLSVEPSGNHVPFCCDTGDWTVPPMMVERAEIGLVVCAAK